MQHTLMPHILALHHFSETCHLNVNDFTAPACGVAIQLHEKVGHTFLARQFSPVVR